MEREEKTGEKEEEEQKGKREKSMANYEKGFLDQVIYPLKYLYTSCSFWP